MDSYIKARFLVDWRNDEKSSIEVDRAECYVKYYGVVYSARYLFSRGIGFKTAFRVLFLRRRRVTKHRYLQVPNQSDLSVRLQHLN